MDTQQGIDEVVRITERCDALFKDLLAIISDLRGNEYQVIPSYQVRFKTWVENLNVFRTSKDISRPRSLALRLLELVEKNLQRGECPDALAMGKMRMAQISTNLGEVLELEKERRESTLGRVIQSFKLRP